MAVNDPGLGADGVLASNRPPWRQQQRIWGIVGIVAFVVIAIVLAANLFTGQKHTPQMATRGFSGGQPYPQQFESKPVATPIAHTMSPPPVPHITAAAPSTDNALVATAFTTTSSSSNGPYGASPSGSNAGNPEKDDEFTAAMTASGVGSPARAHRMKHPSLTVPAGLVVSCILQTAINSELMGFVDCVLPSEVRSADGAVTLMDKGTTIMGQIKSGMRRGQERLFILWTRARTPDNVTVDLASPAADELGRAGVTCNHDADCVNTHFWKMFWTAALYSVIQYGPQVAASALQNNHGGTSVYLNPSVLSPQQNLANTILQEDLKIPPTLEKNQGDLVSIFVARDLDFSGVYNLQMTRGLASTCDNCSVATWTTEKDLARNR